MGIIICYHTGKIMHIDKDAASKQMGNLKRETGYPGECYKCKHCTGWHVGRSRHKVGGFDGKNYEASRSRGKKRKRPGRGRGRGK